MKLCSRWSAERGPPPTTPVASAMQPLLHAVAVGSECLDVLYFFARFVQQVRVRQR